MNLLIGDIGNTITKLSVVDKNKLIIKKIVYFPSIEINSKKILKRNFYKLLKNTSINSTALFSIVVPKYKYKLKKFLKKNYKIFLKEIKDKDINKIIKINLKNKKQVGSDRIANSVGAYKKYKTNCIILDFGTATTFDVVIRNVYQGGIIAPGINISLETLSKKATLIPSINLKKTQKVIGTNTVSAVRSGFFWGYIGLINNIIELIKKETKKSFKIIITGGFSSLFKKKLQSKVFIDKDITIKGLIRTTKLINF